MSITRRNTKTKGSKNAESRLLSPEENQRIFESLGTNASTLSTTVVEVYHAYPVRTKWTKQCSGVACFVKDGDKKSFYIRVYNLQNSKMLWEQEMYNQFTYKATRGFFHTFETDDCQAALNFANVDEAERFKEVIQEKINMLEKRRQKKREERRLSTGEVSSQSEKPPLLTPSGSSMPTIIDVSAQNDIPTRQTSTKRNEKNKKKKKKNAKKILKQSIGGPIGFKHVQHFGCNADSGFDPSNLDPDVKAVLDAAGLSENDLKDEDTSRFVYDFIKKQGGVEAIKSEQEQIRRGTDPLPPLPTESIASPPLPPPPSPSRSAHGARTAQAQPPPTVTTNRPHVPAKVNVQDQPPPPLPSREASLRNRPRIPPPDPDRSLPPLPPPEQSPTSTRLPPPDPDRSLPPLPSPEPSPPSSTAPVPSPPAPVPPAPPPELTSTTSPVPSPPAPPPPPGLPPPPPPLTIDENDQSSSAQSSRGALLNQIHQGATLKKVDPSERTAPSSDSRGDLLAQIRQGLQLKTVEPDDRRQPAPTAVGGIAGALAKALAQRSNVIHSSDDEDSEDEDDFEDEWSD